MTRPWTASRSALALLTLFLVAGTVPIAPASADGALTLAAVLAGHPKVTTLDGKEVELASLATSGSPTVVTFWATWCAPCREEAPHLAELSQQFQAQGLKVIGLTVESPGRDAEKVKRAVRQLEIPYPVAFAARPVYQAFTGPGSTVELPNVFVFDRGGKLVYKFRGYDSTDSPRDLRRAVQGSVIVLRKPRVLKRITPVLAFS